jgi:hypothetical protein
MKMPLDLDLLCLVYPGEFDLDRQVSEVEGVRSRRPEVECAFVPVSDVLK